MPVQGRPRIAANGSLWPAVLLVGALILAGLAVVLPFFIVLPAAVIGAGFAARTLSRRRGTGRVLTAVALILFVWVAIESLLLAANALG